MIADERLRPEPDPDLHAAVLDQQVLDRHPKPTFSITTTFPSAPSSTRPTHTPTPTRPTRTPTPSPTGTCGGVLQPPCKP